MKKSIRVPNGKGFLHVDESMQIPSDYAINSIRQTFIGYYVGSSFRIIRQINPFVPSDISHELLKLQVDYSVPLVAVSCRIDVFKDYVF